MTNTHQPDDMVMISSIKVAYKGKIVEQLLSIFDIEGGYLRAYDERKKQNRGYKGIEFGGKPHLIDTMIIMKLIWEDYKGKYSRVDGISFCWRKSYTLPVC